MRGQAKIRLGYGCAGGRGAGESEEGRKAGGGSDDADGEGLGFRGEDKVGDVEGVVEEVDSGAKEGRVGRGWEKEKSRGNSQEEGGACGGRERDSVEEGRGWGWIEGEGSDTSYLAASDGEDRRECKCPVPCVQTQEKDGRGCLGRIRGSQDKEDNVGPPIVVCVDGG